jgi:hypothetical protein
VNHAIKRGQSIFGLHSQAEMLWQRQEAGKQARKLIGREMALYQEPSCWRPSGYCVRYIRLAEGQIIPALPAFAGLPGWFSSRHQPHLVLTGRKI